MARHCSESFELHKRLLEFVTVKQHVNNIQLAALVSDVTIRKRNVPAHYVVGIARDSASVNGAACRRLTVQMTSACVLLCICHTLCHVGEHFELTVLDQFMTPWLELVGGRSPHAGAKMLWKETVAPATVPGYSQVRWYAKAEIIFVIGEAGTRRLCDFLLELEKRDYGDATTKKMLEIYNTQGTVLRLQIAAMLDIRELVRITYELEGHRLEILLTYDRVETLRAKGRAITNKDDGVLPNVDGVLRRLMELKRGTKFEKYFHGHGVCVGTLEKLEDVESTLYPGHDRPAWLCKYGDGTQEHFEEEELRSGKVGPLPLGQDGKPVLIVRDLPERTAICDALAPGFAYLERRITGQCDQQYSCVEMMMICSVARAFDSNFAAHAAITPAFIDTMQAITPLAALGMLDKMKQELPHYTVAVANAPDFDKTDVEAYTTAILKWWRTNGKSFPNWALAARIVFSLSPNSAECERVFSLVKRLFGDEQLSSLADYLNAALKLNYHKRVVG